MRRTRRAAGLTVLSLAGALVLAGCSDDDTAAEGGDDQGGGGGSCEPAGEPVTLEYYSWVPGMDQVVELWNEQNPDIQVEFVTGPTGIDAYQTFFNGIEAGNAPDLAQIEYDALANFRLQDALVNLADCAGVMDAQDEFIDWTWEQVTFGENDAVYAIPQDTGPIGMWYRADLFAAAGIEPPATWEDYYEAAKVIQAQGGHIHHFSDSDVNWFLGQVWEAGGSWFSVADGEWTVDFTGPESVQVAEYWQRMLDEDLARPMASWSDEWWAALETGEVWTWVSPYWGNALIEQNAAASAGAWAVAPMPQWTEGTNAAGNWGGSTAAVTSSTEHPHEAAQFALWLNTSEEALAALNELGGLYPATTAGQQLPQLNQPEEFFGGQVIAEVFAEAAQNVNPDFPWGPTMTQTYSDIGDGFAAAINGTGTLVEALETGQQKTIEALESQAIPVAGG
ncbi:extracellular solute-binding protein [Jiangella aurantiaca]|uniref:Extracellular solute-binding protein n=1 Tax=Jiangella aurantiaca TaxID=2530373 RepID=A0A4R5ALS7_9ACTN|nr:extracellular solute-binding protein [Jiangella aurantiaca]TDD72590.1 extracellular solute-binding protein [Jiangella aurantiaca]